MKHAPLIVSMLASFAFGIGTGWSANRISVNQAMSTMAHELAIDGDHAKALTKCFRKELNELQRLQ